MMNCFTQGVLAGLWAVSWQFPVWAYVGTLLLLAVFGWVTYYYLRSRRKN